MNAEQALFDAYREWYRLAKAGQKAIGRRDWGFLMESQNITRSIQASVSTLTQEVRSKWRQQNIDGSTKQKRLHELIFKLTETLESNKKLLGKVRTNLRCEQEKLDQAGRNLRRLQNSYATSRPPAWMSFS